MALKPTPVEHPSLSLQGLETRLNYYEDALCLLTSITVKGAGTVSIHDNKTPVPHNSLSLVEYAGDNPTAPANTQLICKGNATIGGVQKKVAAFRKGAAGASESAGAATPAPAQPPAPQTAPVEDGGTGPEGNPNLNSDGTPKTPAPETPAEPAPKPPEVEL